MKFNADSETTTKKKNIGMIIAIVASILAIIIALVVGIVMYIRHINQEESEEESSIEMQETIVSSVVNPNEGVTLDNPLFSTTVINQDEDIFAADFEESNPAECFFINNLE
ncbi:hypothetical protein TVAG_073230 [Trichomonas vaginalis G3]|uniref:Uncharacterized protein n=1 Tax=Trichomonas vaginalis (strain ATCC PRA-98 / G3) TaxID=412133 RepID=A2GAI8_TRIV3|nr:bifunctional inhibitor/lipid-transfer protein/seed storage 2s albumin superfamily protein family [Trichomonas vaginalis G3]EAX85829.1 hypothetical protein TVAG_073230 [Trichomonas vaginalis G3]KAI5550368.1 bifunctional inhibitor/lipid-transfer protein/seed storage 2s albumin superfamily protein family [Trichomonas vaginalis G3]|eukprot:XP_001298759.1 hypothetical protein [Trichomonas vaginalis G3]